MIRFQGLSFSVDEKERLRIFELLLRPAPYAVQHADRTA